MPATRPPLMIGVAGGTGSGKTTVARALLDALGLDAVLLDMDAYYRELGHLSPAERESVNFDHPDAIDLDLFVAHLASLVAGRPIEKPTYDFALHTRTERRVPIAPRDVVVVEGILLYADPRVRSFFDVKVFVDVPDDVRVIRRLQRDVLERGRTMESVVAQYLSTVRPMHLEFVEPSKRHADVILPEGGRNRIAVEMLEARVLEEVRRRRAAPMGG